MIKLNNIQKSFNDFKLNVSFSIQSGEIVGILGESGSGKSTILKIIKNIVKIDSGNIVLDQNINSSFIFQDFNLLYNKNVFHNVALPLRLLNFKKEDIEKKVLKVLNFVNLSHKSNNYISTLSGGEKQRVAIARALVTEPNLLLCDEITSALDEKTKSEIIDLLLKINKSYNTSILFVTHELQVVKKLCNKVLVIEKGKIIENFSLEKKSYKKQKMSYIDYVKEVLT